MPFPCLAHMSDGQTLFVHSTATEATIKEATEFRNVHESVSKANGWLAGRLT